MDFFLSVAALNHIIHISILSDLLNSNFRTKNELEIEKIHKKRKENVEYKIPMENDFHTFFVVFVDHKNFKELLNRIQVYYTLANTYFMYLQIKNALISKFMIFCAGSFYISSYVSLDITSNMTYIFYAGSRNDGCFVCYYKISGMIKFWDYFFVILFNFLFIFFCFDNIMIETFR